MTQEQYNKSIETGYLQLNLGQKIPFWGLVIFFFFFPMIVLIYHLIDVLQHTPTSFSEEDYYVFFIPIVLASLTYWYQKERLKFTRIKTNLSDKEIIGLMMTLCKKLKWTIYFQEEKIFIARSNASYSPGSLGEQITVLIDEYTILVNSINDPNRRGSLTFLGINRKNVKSVTDIIENFNHSNQKA